MVKDVKILNCSDKTRHYSVVTGKGYPKQPTDELVTDLAKYPVGSQFTDLEGKEFYVRMGGEAVIADWHKVGGTVTP